MANTDKNILITPNIGQTAYPKIEFTGADNNKVTLNVLDDGTLSFEGSAGQLFSITDNLSGTIFSVNDVSGIPSIEVDDTGEVRIAEYSGAVLIGTSTDNGTDKLQVNGSISATAFKGNADTATKLATARNIAVTGAVTGNANFDGSGNISITTTLASGAGFLPTTGGTLTGILTLNAATPEIHFNGTSDAGVDMAIKATPEGLDFYEPEDGNKIHFQILDDAGVNSPFGYKVGTNVVWHQGNDGIGSGLDADLLDGLHAQDIINAATTAGGVSQEQAIAYAIALG